MSQYASDPPILKATMSSGAVWLDPSEDLLFELLSDIDRGDEVSFNLERTTDPTGQTFVKVVRPMVDRYVLERQDGSPDRRFRAEFSTLREAHEPLTMWAFELHGWEGLPAWEPA